MGVYVGAQDHHKNISNGYVWGAGCMGDIRSPCFLWVVLFFSVFCVEYELLVIRREDAGPLSQESWAGEGGIHLCLGQLVQYS